MVFLALQVYQNLGCGRELVILFVNHYMVYFLFENAGSSVFLGGAAVSAGKLSGFKSV